QTTPAAEVITSTTESSNNDDGEEFENVTPTTKTITAVHSSTENRVPLSELGATSSDASIDGFLIENIVVEPAPNSSNRTPIESNETFDLYSIRNHSTTGTENLPPVTERESEETSPEEEDPIIIEDEFKL